MLFGFHRGKQLATRGKRLVVDIHIHVRGELADQVLYIATIALRHSLPKHIRPIGQQAIDHCPNGAVGCIQGAGVFSCRRFCACRRNRNGVTARFGGDHRATTKTHQQGRCDHYAGHSDQEIVFGEPKPRHVKMFEGVKTVRNEVLKHVRAGITQRELFDVYEATCEEVGYATSDHAQMHQYGIDIPEFPGLAFRIEDSKGGRGLGGGGNFTLETGMIYSISPTLIDGETGETLLGGTSLAVTDDGHQELGDREVELLVAG